MADQAFAWDSLFRGLQLPQDGKFISERAGFEGALRKMQENGVRMVLLQSAKATGDIFQVGACLCCEANFGVILVCSEDDKTKRDKPDMIISHYLSDWKISPIRVIALKTPDPEKAIKVLTPLRVLTFGGCNLEVATVGHATNILAQKLDIENEGSAEQLAQFRKRLLDGANVTDDEIFGFLDRKGIKENQHIVVLWSRGSGKLGGLHPNLDSSTTAMAQLCGKLAEFRTVIVAGDLKPEKIGEHSGFERSIFLGKFWEDDPFRGKTRACQLKVFDLLLSKSQSLVHVGMRSGTLDSYALLKHRVIHIVDEAEVGQGLDDRMAKLVDGKNPMSYERFVAGNAPKLFGQFSSYAEKDRRYYPISSKSEVLGFALKAALNDLKKVLKGQYPEMVMEFEKLLAEGNGRDQYRYFKQKFVVNMSKLYTTPYVKEEIGKKVAVNKNVEAIMELYERLLAHVLKVVHDRRGFGQDDLDRLVLQILKGK